MEIYVDNTESDEQLQLYDRLNSKVELLKDRKDAQAIHKASELSRAIQSNESSDTSLVGRVSNELPPDPLIQEMREKLEEIGKICETIPGIEPNYLIKIQQIVGKLLAQLNRISQKDRDQIDAMKKKFDKMTNDSAQQMKASGWNDFKFALIGLGASLLQFSPYPSDQAIGKTLAEQFFPGLGKLFGTDMQARMRLADAVANMILQEYSAKTSRGQSDSSNKQEIINLIDKTIQSVKEAARSG